MTTSFIARANGAAREGRSRPAFDLGYLSYSAGSWAEAWGLVDGDHAGNHLDGFTPDELEMAVHVDGRQVTTWRPRNDPPPEAAG